MSVRQFSKAASILRACCVAPPVVGALGRVAPPFSPTEARRAISCSPAPMQQQPHERRDRSAFEPKRLISEIPPTPVKGHSVECNGGGGPLGHPKVFINLDKPGPQPCGYCGLRFVREE